MSDAARVVVAERYELETIVGRGGYGVVYRAHDRLGQKPVAVKVLAPGAARDPSVVERMVREQQAMVALAGTRAVSAVDLCRLPSGALCLVMEWLEGEDLEHYLGALEQSGARMSIPRLLEIVGAVADTLGKAHQIGIVHRDVKPANIFLMSNEPGGVRLLDFGLSRMKTAATLTAVGTVMGSPSYIAPESWRGDSKQIDQRADIYSLGVIAYRALSGQMPFASDSLVGQLKLVTTAPRPSLRALRPDLPLAIDAWVQQSLAIDPEQRFRTAPALHTALSEALGMGIPGEASAEASPEMETFARHSLASAFRAAKALLQRFTRKSEPPAASRQGENFEPTADKKSFVAEWLSGSELKVADTEEDAPVDIVSWLGGQGSPGARPEVRARSKPPKPPVRAKAKRLPTLRGVSAPTNIEAAQNVRAEKKQKQPATQKVSKKKPAKARRGVTSTKSKKTKRVRRA